MSIGIVKNGEVSKLHKVYKPIKLIIPNLLFDELVTGVLSGEGIINIERKRIWREIDKLNRKNEILSDKILNI